MSDEQQHRPRFEPPPWEQEAFERFRAEQEEMRKQAELDEALRLSREASRPAVDVDAAVTAATPAEAGPVEPAAAPVAATAGSDTVMRPEKPVVPEARIDSMLIQLKGEEPAISHVNGVFVNVVIAIFELGGLFTIVEAALLFGKVRATGAAGMLGALASLIMLLVGLGFMGAGFLLFRKHHS